MFDEISDGNTRFNGEDSVQTLITNYGTKFSDYLAMHGGGDSDQEEKNENTFMIAYNLTGQAKVAGITDFMETLIENNCKFMVFAHH